MPLFSSEAPGSDAQPWIPAYSLQRSRRRTIAIHVHDGRVEVRAPLRVSQREIAAFVREKTGWIEKKLAELRERSVEQFRVDDGCTLDVMGETLVIRWQAAVRSEVRREHDSLWICGRALDSGKARRLFLRWLANEADAQLLPLAGQCVARMGLGHRFTGFTLRYTRSLWGRCSSRGDILFNPLIMLAPLPVVEYLVVHEVCHLQHMNHSRAFWMLVASACPTWQNSRQWLKTHGHRLRVG
ncbi:MAG TPA: SprT family zinc-dependent metalloprotease [Pseudomonadales bacterium]|nr:SprT family zinc-dependent metalloprotease [Pseudomonadales bacterium]